MLTVRPRKTICSPRCSYRSSKHLVSGGGEDWHTQPLLSRAENREGTGFANMNEFEGDEMSLDTQISSEPCFEDIVGEARPCSKCCTGDDRCAHRFHRPASRRQGRERIDCARDSQPEPSANTPYVRMNCRSWDCWKANCSGTRREPSRSVIAEMGRFELADGARCFWTRSEHQPGTSAETIARHPGARIRAAWKLEEISQRATDRRYSSRSASHDSGRSSRDLPTASMSSHWDSTIAGRREDILYS